MSEPFFFKFRFTFDTKENIEIPLDIEEQRNHKCTVHFFMTFFKGYYLGKMTSGIEYYNGSGGRAKGHCHIHFTSPTRQNSIITTLKRQNPHLNLTKNNYCLKLHTIGELNNEERFWRYPLKQGILTSKRFILQEGFNEAELQIMHKCAYDSWQISCEINEKKDTSDNDTLLTRIIAQLRSTHLDEVHLTEREIYHFIVMFYKNNNKAINITVCKNYVNNVLLETARMSIEDFCNKTF